MKQVTRLFDLLDLYKDEYSSSRKVFNIIEKGIWRSYSAADYVSLSNKVSIGLLSSGAGKGTRIATLVVNSPEWNFLDMGIMQIGAIQIPVYPTISEENLRFILNDSSAEYLFVSNKCLYDRVCKIASEVPSLRYIYSIDEIEGVTNWQQLLDTKLSEQVSLLKMLGEIKSGIGSDEMMTIIYTSGTTGRPKGVMLSHRNFVSNYQALNKIPPIKHGDRVISFLPLCHVYERTAGYCYQSGGVSIYYVQAIDELAECIKQVKPHAFTTVPRVLEKIYNSFIEAGRNLPLVKRVLFFWSVRQGHKFDLRDTGNLFYRFKLSIANILILSRLKKELGGHIRFIVSGSATLHPGLTKIFWAAKMPVLEAYGLTETSPGITMCSFDRKEVRFGTVGKLLDDVEVKIAPDGEILVKSPGVMLGYLNRPERTAEVIDNEGWFHTGDIGEMEEGFLKITDRKKEMFKTSSGKYIAPQVIERKLKESSFIEYIMVVGENRKCTSALIVPDFRYLKSWCKAKHMFFISREKAITNPIIINRFQREIDRYNLDLGQTEKIKKFVLLADDWSIASGELSPTLKLIRKTILQKYCSVIDQMYGDKQYDYHQEST